MAAVFQAGDPEELVELTDLLDEGSSGAVFQGMFQSRACAVKVIPGLDNPELFAEITHEISLLRELGPTNELFVKLLGAWEKEAHAWVCLELCEVGSVIDLCQVCQTNLELPELQMLTRSVLLALEHLHRDLGVVHRDVKGKNILLNARGMVKLTDFGIAVRLSAERETVQPAGSPHWMAPELVVDKRTGFDNDVWSLGITLIELFEGEPPHCEVLDPIRVLEVIHASPAPTLKLRAHPDLDEFLAKCFLRDQRPSASELLAEGFASQPPADGDEVMLKLCQRAMPILHAYRHFQKSGEVLETPPPLGTESDDHDNAKARAWSTSSLVRVPVVSEASREPISSLVRVEASREPTSSLVRVEGHAQTHDPSVETLEESIRNLTLDRNRKHPQSIRNMRELQSQSMDADVKPPKRKTTALRIIKSMISLPHHRHKI